MQKICTRGQAKNCYRTSGVGFLGKNQKVQVPCDNLSKMQSTSPKHSSEPDPLIEALTELKTSAPNIEEAEEPEQQSSKHHDSDVPTEEHELGNDMLQKQY